jgi:hypothetical protein
MAQGIVAENAELYFNDIQILPQKEEREDDNIPFFGARIQVDLSSEDTEKMYEFFKRHGVVKCQEHSELVNNKYFIQGAKMTATLLSGIGVQLAISQYTWEMNSQIAKLAFKWRVTEVKVYELVELHYGHSVGVWQDSIDALENLNYAQAQDVVERTCIGASA